MIEKLKLDNLKIDSLHQLIKKSKETRTPFVIRDFYKPMFDWNFAIKFLNMCMVEKEENTHITKTGDYYFILQPNESYHQIYSDYYDLLNKSHPDGVILIPVILVSIFNNIPNLTEHADPVDQMHLAISGSSNWKLTMDDGNTEELVMSPGDFIFMPHLIKHEVTSISHRIGLTFSSEHRI